MGGDVRLDKDGVLLRIQAAGDIGRDLCQRPPAQVRRILTDRDGVEVRQHVIALIFIRQLHPVFDGPQVRAQCQFTAGLNAGEDDFFLILIFHIAHP